MQSSIIKSVIIFILALTLFPKETWAASPVTRGLVQTDTGAPIPGVWVQWQDNSDQSRWGKYKDNEPTPGNFNGLTGPVYPSTDYAGKVCGGYWYDDGAGNNSWEFTSCCSDINGNSIPCPAYSNIRYVQTSASPVTYYSGDLPSNYIFPSWSGDGSGNSVDLGGGYILQGLSQQDRINQTQTWIDTDLSGSNDSQQANTLPHTVYDPPYSSAPTPIQNLQNGQYTTFGCLSNPHALSVVTDVSRTSGTYQPDKRTFYSLGNSQAEANVNFTYVSNPACTVSWNIPSSIAANSNFQVKVTPVASTLGDWGYVTLRLNDVLVPLIQGSLVANSASATGYDTVYTINSGPAGTHNLKFRIHDYSSYGVATGPQPDIDCTPDRSFSTTNYPPPPTPPPGSPIISSLTIGNGGNPTGGTAAKTSGLTAGDPGLISGQTGNDWFNPMIITLNASAVSPATINKYYVAFYDKNGASSPPFNNPAAFLSDVQGLINTDIHNGFLLRSDASGGYYVWVNNNWNPIAAGGTTICLNNIIDCSNITTDQLYKVRPYQPSSGPGKWEVTLYKKFAYPVGSKAMFTPGYVEDNQATPLTGFNANLNP